MFKDTLASFGGRWETRIELPIETEILIPDYLPAVFKIVKCLIAPVILQNRAASGRWHCEGYLRCTVYYQSEEPGCRLYRTEQKFSFEKSVDLPEGRYAEGPAFVSGETEYCNCRAVSEHRIDLRGAYILSACVLIRREQELLTSLADCGIEQRTSTLQGLHRLIAEEKTLTAETNFPLSSDGESILDINGRFVLSGLTAAAGQVHVQGTLLMQFCSQLPSGEELSVRSRELPVRQTAELPGTADDDTCLAWGEVLACTLSSSEGSGDASLSVTWKLHLEVWRSVNFTAVADAYSTLCKTQTVQTVCKLLQKSSDLNTHLALTVEDDLPDPDVTVLGCFVTLGAAVPQSAEGEKSDTHICLSGKGTAHVLCCDSRGEITCYDKPFTWRPDILWPGVSADAWPCIHAAVSRVSSGKDGPRLRVEIELELSGVLLQAHAAPALCGVELGETYDDSDGPSLYIYYAKEGEHIFNISKRYHARARDLIAANKLDSGDTPPEDIAEAACLLIPAAL